MFPLNVIPSLQDVQSPQPAKRLNWPTFVAVKHALISRRALLWKLPRARLPVYVDTAKLLIVQWINLDTDWPAMKAALLATGCRDDGLRPRPTHPDSPYRHRLEIQGPTPATYLLLAKMFPGHILSGIDPATDCQFDDPMDTAAYRQDFNASRTINWRPKNAKTGRSGDTVYSSQRKVAGSNRITGRNTASYNDDKEDDDPLDHHFELRLRTAKLCQDNGFRTIRDLIRPHKAKLAEVFLKYVDFSAVCWRGLDSLLVREATKLVNTGYGHSVEILRCELWDEVLTAIHNHLSAADAVPSAQDLLDSHRYLRHDGVAVHVDFFDLCRLPK